MEKIESAIKQKQLEELKSIEKIVTSSGDPKVSKLLSRRNLVQYSIVDETAI